MISFYHHVKEISTSKFKSRHLITDPSKCQPRKNGTTLLPETWFDVRDSPLFSVLHRVGKQRLLAIQNDGFFETTECCEKCSNKNYEAAYIINACEKSRTVVVAYARRFGDRVRYAFETDEMNCMVRSGTDYMYNHFDAKDDRFHLPSDKIVEEDWSFLQFYKKKHNKEDNYGIE